MSDDKIIYICALCEPGDEYQSSDRSNVRRHITMQGNNAHKDHKGDDPGVIEEMTQRDLETIKANERNDHDGEETTITAGKRSYTGPASGLDLTGQHISERPVTGKPQHDAGDVVIDVGVEDKVAVLLDAGDWARVLGAEGLGFRVREEIVTQLSGIGDGDGGP